MSVLSSRAMLSSLTVRQWSGRKLDREVSSKATEAHNAAADAGRFNKALIPPAAFAKIVAAVSEARTYHAKMTLPWNDTGARILPAAAYLAYTAEMRAIRARFDAAVTAFIAAYPDLKAEARTRLGDMFRAEEFPHCDDIESRFGFAISLNPVPDAADFRVDIGEEAAAAIRADIEERAADSMKAAMRDLFDRVSDVAGRMAERLRAYKPGTDGNRAEGVFRDSLVENVRELAGILPVLNVADDPKLAELAGRLVKELGAHDADALRDSDNLRTKTAEAAERILAEVSDYLA